jgi:uncharacterized lipoprotein YmbA
MKPKTDLLRFGAALLAGVFLLVFPGCINLDPVEDPTQTYILHPEDLSPVALSSDNESVSLYIERVEIPPYLDDRRLVTRLSPNKLQYHEFHRWAEPIAEGIGRVIAENLDSMQVVSDVSYYPWRQFGSSDHRIRLKIFHFEKSEGAQVSFSGIAEVYAPGDKLELLSKHNFNVRVPVQSDDMESIIAAMSAALADFSENLAEGYRNRMMDL